MSDLVARGLGTLVGVGDDYGRRRAPRDVQRAVDAESARGLIGAAHVQAASFVAHVSMINLDTLSRMEATAAATDPVVASRYSGIVEDFLLVARCELRRMARE